MRNGYNCCQVLFLFLMLLFFNGCDKKQLINVDLEFKGASVKTEQEKLIVKTQKIERVWELTNVGLKTISLKDLETGKIYTSEKNDVNCDWSYFGLIDDQSNAKLIGLSAKISNDEGFTSDHIEVVAEFEYPEVESFIKYIIWVYPDAPGVRTQLFIKGKAGKYLKESNITKRDDLEFNLVQGEYSNSYKASSFADLNIATTTEDVKAVVYHIKGLNKSKKYLLGFSWWDFEGSDIEENVWVTSVDGEIKQPLLKNEKLPNFKKDKAHYEIKLVDLPGNILVDGTFRLIFERVNGKKAVVSEIFLYEFGERQVSITSSQEERIIELKREAPESTTLVGYLDCGIPITGEKLVPTGRVDYVPVNTAGAKTTFVGYFNDTQHRNTFETPLMKEISLNTTDEVIHNNWSNLVAVVKDGQGVIELKESHKCVNQYGVDTGNFIITGRGIENTGTALFPSDIKEDEYSWCWASWTLLFHGGEDELEMAVKQFDRLRFPVDKTRDIYIQANTWGSDRGKEASKEENVLIELESQKSLGIDVQQIDDGWQSGKSLPFDSQLLKDGEEETKKWMVRNDWYPEGWSNVVAKSKETGVKLGLWGAAQPITLDALKWNYDQAGFNTYKLDFADLTTHQKMDDLMTKVRSFIKYTNHKVRVNWDLTENAPRYGYYWAKEYGCVYLENRKPKVPENAVYIPSLVLRDIWQLSKYTNVNRFQTTIQNIEMVNRELSDAYLYNHQYSVAIGLVGTPLFFQETHLYSKQAKDQIRPLLAKYKDHREALYDMFVFPLGDEPNDESWTGFQWVKSNAKDGYLMIFRELNNSEKQKDIQLRFVRNRDIQLKDLISGESFVAHVNEQGYLTFTLIPAAGFRFFYFSNVINMK